MSVRQSLLAILDQGPCYGYQLRTEFDRRTGSTWPLNVGQIYNTLDRLERDGLVAKADTDEQGHVYYAITSAGRAEVAEWLGSPVSRGPSPARDELAIKLAVAATLPGIDIAEVVQVQRAASLRGLQDLTRAKRTAEHPCRAEDLAGLLVLDSLIFTAEAEVRWLDDIEGTLQRAAADGVHGALPLATDAPKRGRPVKAAVAEAGTAVTR
ncbi:MAG TPA: PadR family transcriptional regulator [Humibacter sp.]|jgi:DNA-binding PadR family transcriptional regulator|nr:PadR family transcriptional regulator [Humibacter sp.]